MNDTVTTAPQPSVAQLVSAFAAAALPFAGPQGVAIAALIPAAEQLIETFRNSGKTNFTVDDLAGIVADGNVALASLKGHVAALL